MRSFNTVFCTIGMVVLLAVMVSGCAGSPVTQEAKDAGNATAEGMFKSFNTGDYGQFSEHFSDVMKRSINESQFDGMRDQVRGKYGDYEAKTLTASGADASYNSLVYSCQFANGTLKIRVVTGKTNLSTVEGLWFPDGV